jgi:WD40 repeat protein
MTNPNKVLYTSICWDDVEKLLYISDELGHIYVAYVYLGDKYTITKKVCNQRIKKINIYDDGINRYLFVFMERGMKAFKIKIGQKTLDIEGHTDSILKIICLDPKRLKTNEQIRDKPKIITCSLDNTIRLWDSKKMDVINVLESPDNSELSCMAFLANSCLVATGHEDGAIRLWNLEISSSVVLKS